MEWHQIENFIAVAKHKHFTKAALQKSVSQPALSRSIMRLEKELGVQLFFREGRSVRLTKYGQLFLKKAKQAQISIQEGIKEIQGKVSTDTGEVSLAFLNTFGPHLIPNLIARYQKMYPKVTFLLYQGGNDYVINQVEQGLADMCLSSPPTQKGKIHWTSLQTEPLYLVVSKQHRLSKHRYVSLKSLEEENFVCFKQGYGLRYIFDEMCLKLNVQPNITFEGEEATTIAGFIAEGLGVAVLPKISDIKNDNLCFLDIADYSCKRKIALSCLSDEFLTPIAKHFKDFVIEYFATIELDK